MPVISRQIIFDSILKEMSTSKKYADAKEVAKNVVGRIKSLGYEISTERILPYLNPSLPFHSREDTDSIPPSKERWRSKIVNGGASVSFCGVAGYSANCGRFREFQNYAAQLGFHVSFRDEAVCAVEGVETEEDIYEIETEPYGPPPNAEGIENDDSWDMWEAFEESVERRLR